MRYSCEVLKEAIELQTSKSQDYQNPNSQVLQPMHYRRGIDTIHDIIVGKIYRAQSILESAKDSYMDMINYASFAVAYLRGKMEGQNPESDIFNKKIK